jgi:predicted Zn-dependent protease
MKKKVLAICMAACLGSLVCLFGPPAADGEDPKAKEQPKGPAGLLEKLMDPKSKESQIVQGVGSILGSTSEIDYESERTIGESLALEGFRRYGMPVKDAELQTYINLVGNAVARNSLRPGIPYAFVVVDSPLQNAFSCPGGIIFISSGLLKTIQDEAQLAGILAHEVAHVGHKHALQSIQRARFFQGVGKITSATMKGEKGKEFEDMIGNLQSTLFDKGLDQNMEFEADKSAMETAYRTGYNPEGIVEVLRELKKIEARSQKQGSWFSTHPPLSERIRRCEAEMGQYPDAKSLTRLPDRYKKVNP